MNSTSRNYRQELTQMERQLAELRSLGADKRDELQSILRAQAKNIDEVEDLHAKVAALDSLRPWYELGTFRLERNDCSRLHKLAEAFKSNRVIGADEKSPLVAQGDESILVENAHSFVVQHDWARAFEGATDYEAGEFNLPFEHCAFEFRISGRTVIVIALQPTEENRAKMENAPSTRQIAIPFVECGGYWWCREEIARTDPSLIYVWTQIQAICVALDAEVATREVVRAPVRLNEKRTKHGEVPLPDYHVIKLHGRVAHQAARGASDEQKRRRLHFRRGHWRHYETHKTWIRWMLVGDLGFIDKSYRL